MRRVTWEDAERQQANRKQSAATLFEEIERSITEYEDKQLPADIDTELELGYQDYDEQRDNGLSFDERPF